MKILKNPNLPNYSRELRKNMTKEEKHLWYDFLKKQKTKTIKRQQIIGDYIVDFYCEQAKLVIELDGCQHYKKDIKVKDCQRDKYLCDCGMTVLRYTNLQINEHFEDVCLDILMHLQR